MTIRPGLFIAEGAAGKTGPQDARLALAGILPTTGVLAGLVVSGSSSGANMKYVITAGSTVTARGAVATDGVYLTANDGSVTVDSGAPAPSSGSRWDIVWVRAKNANDGFGDANSTPEFGVTVGVSAASSPTKPYAVGSGASGTSVPAGALALAESLVGANISNAAAATITRVAKPTAVNSAVLRVAGTSEYPVNPVVGQYIDDANLGLLRWNGTVWRPVTTAGAGATPAGGITLDATTGATGWQRNTGSAVEDSSHPMQGGVAITGSGLSVPVAGYYTVTLISNFTTGGTSGTGRRGISVAVGADGNGAPLANSITQVLSNQTNASGTMNVSGTMFLTAGTVLSAFRYTDTAGNYQTCDARIRAVLATR